MSLKVTLTSTFNNYLNLKLLKISESELLLECLLECIRLEKGTSTTSLKQHDCFCVTC